MKTFKERRRYVRYKVKNRSTVLTYPHIVLSFSVIDVSDGGLSFTYTGWENWPKEGIKIDILDREFFLENIPVQVVNDVQLDEKSKSLRRCSVQFSNLEEKQKYILDRYIVSVATS